MTEEQVNKEMKNEEPTTETTTETEAAAGGDQSGEPDNKAHRDAARYRRELREVEAERDQLKEQVAQLRIRDVNAAFGKELEETQVQALWDIGLDPTGFLTETGDVNTERVSEVLEALRAGNWGLKLPSLSNRPRPALRGGSTPSTFFEQKDWTSALQGDHR